MEGATEVVAAFRHMAALFPPRPGDAFESAPLPPLSLPSFAHLAFLVHLVCAVSFLPTLFWGLSKLNPKPKSSLFLARALSLSVHVCG
jgi:hypothetical protein